MVITKLLLYGAAHDRQHLHGVHFPHDDLQIACAREPAASVLFLHHIKEGLFGSLKACQRKREENLHVILMVDEDIDVGPAAFYKGAEQAFDILLKHIHIQVDGAFLRARGCIAGRCV